MNDIFPYVINSEGVKNPYVYFGKYCNDSTELERYILHNDIEYQTLYNSEDKEIRFAHDQRETRFAHDQRERPFVSLTTCIDVISSISSVRFLYNDGKELPIDKSKLYIGFNGYPHIPLRFNEVYNIPRCLLPWHDVGIYLDDDLELPIGSREVRYSTQSVRKTILEGVYSVIHFKGKMLTDNFRNLICYTSSRRTGFLCANNKLWVSNCNISSTEDYDLNIARIEHIAYEDNGFQFPVIRRRIRV